MGLLTFAEAKSSRLQEVAQACSSSDEFRSLLNEATEGLMNRGDFVGTLIPIHVCVRNGCVTWPRYVKKVRRINRCGDSIRIGNLWYDFIDHEVYNGWGNSWGWGNEGWIGNFNGAYGCNSSMRNQGRFPTYSDVTPSAPRYLQAYCLCQADVGKTITFFGLDNNLQPLQTHNPDGTWSDGITLTLAIPFVRSSVTLGRIDRVSKQVTSRRVPVYAFDPVNNVEEDIAVYEAGETDPNYERDQIHGAGASCNSTSKCTSSIAALVKLQFIPVVADTDLVMISNVRALKFMIQAIKLEEGGQDDKAEIKIRKAVQELNLELEDNYPQDQNSVDTGFMGGSYAGFQKMI